jgi:hypothetical protein
MALNKPTLSIIELDLKELIDHKVSEGKILEYKSKLLVNNDREKKEFLADVSSFANASGGHIIYGMKETDGVGAELPGISGVDPDKEKLRLDSIIRDGISPRVIGTTIYPFKLENGNYAIVIHIPQSWVSPHMVVYQGTSRFYTRDSAGKIQIDVDEVRQVFLASGSVGEKIRNFRLERLSQISALETPVPLKEGTELVLHIVPLSAFQSFVTVDIKDALSDFSKFLQEMYLSRFNLDGLVSYATLPDGAVTRYIQLYRNGAIEAVDWLLMNGLDKKRLIPEGFESVVIRSCKDILQYQQHLGIEPPIFIFLTFLHVKGWKIDGNSQYFRLQHSVYNHEIDRDDLLLPEITIEDYSSINNLPNLLKPVFDACWNACGWPGSINYDKNGKYTY